MRKVIVNSTPIIALSHIGQLSLLHELYGEYILPEAVYQELHAKSDSRCSKALEEQASFYKVCKIQNEMAKEFFKSQLHAGEVEVMILAKELNGDLVIIDDANAKKHAKYLGLNVTGTLGIILKAKRCGIIREVKPLLEKMVANHIYLSPKLISICLKQAGEE